jgi:uncharacterized protein (DUF1499 family)
MGLFSGSRPDNLGVRDGRLAPCPTSPNCVTSEGDPQDAEHHVEPLAFPPGVTDPDLAWEAVERAVRGLERTIIVTARPGYLHAECSSALLGFVDDLECLLDRRARAIQVRSASRLGYSDLGVNRKRVEALRRRLAGG